MTTLTFQTLLDAYEWVSVSAPFENEAYIDHEMAKVYLASVVIDVEDALADDIEDGANSAVIRGLRVAMHQLTSDCRLA